MGCFCHDEVEKVQRKLQQMAKGAPADDAAAQTATNQQQAKSVAESAALLRAREVVAESAARLRARGLPAPPWKPDPAWLTRKFPAPQLSPESQATLAQLATLRQQMVSGFGTDPLKPEQAKPLKRIVATLNRRLAELAKSPPPDAAPWHRLADESEAADTVQEAAKSGLLDPSPEQVEAYSQPAGRPMQQWLPMLRQVRAVAPLLAVARQLDLPEDEPEALAQHLADAVRRLRSLDLPPTTEPLRAAQLMSLLSATERLRQSFGADPTESDYEHVKRAVERKTQAAAELLGQQQRARQTHPLPYCPSTLATPDAVKAAASKAAEALSAIDWKVPPASNLPAMQSGLQASTLAQQMAKLLGSSPVRSSPCGHSCDAATAMRDLG